MWAVKGRAVETHGVWRQERAGSEAPEEEAGCRTVYEALESCLGNVLGRLSLRCWRSCWRRCAPSRRRLESTLLLLWPPSCL